MFRKASSVNKKLKVLIYGPSGAGKTHFGLTFPKPAVIDTECGTELFGDRFNFDVLRTKDFNEVLKAVEHVANGGYETLIVDPITVLWQVLMEAGQLAAEQRAKRNRRNPDEANLTPRDWGIIKRKINALYTRLVNMPCHVVVVGRIKDVNETRNNQVFKVGERVDAEKSTEYLFDIIIKIKNENGKRYGMVEKDRSGRLQGQRIENPSFDSLGVILNVVSSGTEKAESQNPTDAAEKLTGDFEEGVKEKAKHAPKLTSAPRFAFHNQATAIEWGWKSGAFNAIQHAENAYDKCKVNKKPTDAYEMAAYWKEDIANRLDVALQRKAVGELSEDELKAWLGDVLHPMALAQGITIPDVQSVEDAHAAIIAAESELRAYATK
jgi:hypothetical protein